MKLTMLFIGLLGLFIAPGFAEYNINVDDNGNVAGSGQQSVSVNNAHNVANVDNNDGWNSWNSLWDYKNGFAATRLFAKKSCIVHKMNNDVMPSLQVLDSLVKEKKGKGPGGQPPKTLKYSIKAKPVDDLNQFGQNIVVMCKGLPTYVAEEIPGNMPFSSEKCYDANVLWILNIYFCESAVQTN